MKNLGVYIHIPFCKSKCYYCDFLSFAQKESYYDFYVKALLEEIDSCEEMYDCKITSVFFGGGTPTLISEEHLHNIIAKFTGKLNSDAEVTIEANPDTVTKEQLKILRAAGFNRISFGLQASQDFLLKKIGRSHTSKNFENAFSVAIESDFRNINVDLMFALPDQTFEDWQETLIFLEKFHPQHISIYSLIIEEKTKFHHMKIKNQINLASDELDREMFHFAKKFLLENGYYQYEISNFAKKEFECKHNIMYWQRGDYLGFGLGAHSLYNNVRWNNTQKLREYISGNQERQNILHLSLNNMMEEFMFLGLRMTQGIKISDFEKNFGVSVFDIYGEQINDMLSKKLLCMENNRIYLTDLGVDVSNYVLANFIV